MDKSDSDGFFSKRLGCRTNDRSYNSTDSSLITVDSDSRYARVQEVHMFGTKFGHSISNS